MSEKPKSPPIGMITAILCAVLLIFFAMISFSASLGKSANYDEPLHLLGGYVHRTLGDFRLNPEDPALFGYIATLPISDGDIKLTFNVEAWQRMHEDFTATQWIYSMNVLYRTDENRPDALLARSRFIFVIVGMMLGALIAWWSWRLAGAIGAIAATLLFTFDPNFLGHTSLVKNDVTFSLLLLAMVMSAWRFGQRGTWLGLAGIAISCAAAINVKFSAMLCGPILACLLILRALLPMPWIVLGKTLESRAKRLIAAVVVCIVTGVTCYVAIWACYGFRFAPTNDPGIRLNTSMLVRMLKMNRVAARHQIGDTIPTQEFEDQPLGAFAGTLIWAEKNELLPQSFTEGLLYTYATTFKRGSYLLGRISHVGWWYYFPLAMLFKTATVTLLAILAACAIGIVTFLRRRASGIDWWTIASLGLPLIIYGFSSMTSNMNVGVRHVLPMYPLIYVALAVAIAEAIRRWRIPGIAITSILLVGLMVESLAAYPNYIAFFNAPSGSVSRGGLELLSDSNLDWGQDLPLLAEWQKAHANKKLYLNYFGTADPAEYGIVATHMPGGWRFAESTGFPSPTESCYIAIGATSLQGVFYLAKDREVYQPLRDAQPLDVLGGTIYIFEMPLKRSQ